MDIDVREVRGADLEAALELEKKVFLEEDYPYDYERYNHQSTMFGAFDRGRCVGALRLITQAPLEPPVLTDCVIWDRDAWTRLGGSFEELATHAVESEYRSQGVGLMLMKAAYSSARRRGVTHLAVITEPSNAEFLNNTYHFVCNQIGDVGFKGWDCAPYIQVLDDFEASLAGADPRLYSWVTDGLPDALISVPRTTTDRT